MAFMEPFIPVNSGEYVFGTLANDLRASPQRQVLLIADENTYPACGQASE
jgi:hypothetical protein